MTRAPPVADSSEVAAQRPPTIAVAANLNFALTEIAEQFARDSGSRVEIVLGASGALTRQIQDGAPFDLFLAADEEFPNQLSRAGLTRDSGVVYTVGRLVLFAPKGSPLAVDERLEGLGRLVKSDGVSRFAIANPEVAPYGRAAEAVLRKRGTVGCPPDKAGARRHDRAGRAVRHHRKCRRRSHRLLPRPRSRLLGSRHLRAHSHRRPSAASPADGAAQAGRPGGRTVLCVPPESIRARDPQETWLRGARIAPMDWTALRVSLWLGAGTIAILLPFGMWFGRLLAFHQFRGKLLVEALVTVPLVIAPHRAGLLLPRHVRRALAARPGLPGSRGRVAAVLV